MEEIFFIDFEKDRLTGWEPKKSDLVIASIEKAINMGFELPPVPVHKIAPNHYHLSVIREDHTGYSDGGHYRAVTCYIKRKLLKAILIPGESDIPQEMQIDIRNIKIVNDTGQFEEHKKKFPNYLSVE